MKILNNIKATSIVEAIIVMLIITSGVTGMYHIYSQSIKLSNGITNKIKAIQIAKQGIETVTNIRDTNWILFSSDYKNCWNTLSYESNCIGNNTTTYDINNNKSYIVFQDNYDRWILEEKTTGSFSNNTYRNRFKVGLNNGTYTQSGITKEFKRIFTREIKISYLKDDGTSGNSNDSKMVIKSIVQWKDNSSDNIRRVEIDSILSNWKK